MMTSEIAKKYGKELFQRYGNPCTSVEAKEVAVAGYTAFVQSAIEESNAAKDAEIERLHNLIIHDGTKLYCTSCYFFAEHGCDCKVTLDGSSFICPQCDNTLIEVRLIPESALQGGSDGK